MRESGSVLSSKILMSHQNSIQEPVIINISHIYKHFYITSGLSLGTFTQPQADLHQNSAGPPFTSLPIFIPKFVTITVHSYTSFSPIWRFRLQNSQFPILSQNKNISSYFNWEPKSLPKHNLQNKLFHQHRGWTSEEIAKDFGPLRGWI